MLLVISCALQFAVLGQYANVTLISVFVLISSIFLLLLTRSIFLSLLFFLSIGFSLLSSIPLLDHMARVEVWEKIFNAWGSTVIVETELSNLRNIDRFEPGGLRAIADASIEGQNLGAISVVIPELPWIQSEAFRSNDTVRGLIEFKNRDLFKADTPQWSYQGYLYRRGIVIRGKLLSVLDKRSVSKETRIEQIHNYLVREFQGRDASAVLLATALGSKDLLGEHISTLFRETGTTHLLVISGFHISAIFSFIFSPLRFIWLRSLQLTERMRAFTPAAILGVSFIACYLLIISRSIPAERSWIFILFALCAEILLRKNHAMRVWCISFYFIILLWPACFLEVGCQLSFSAIAGILFFTQTEKHKQRKTLIYSYFVVPFLVSVFAWAATTPITLLWFSSVVWGAPFINALIAPLFSFITLAFGGLSLFLSAVGFPYYGVLVRASLGAIDCLIWLIEKLNKLSKTFGLGFLELETSSLYLHLFLVGLLILVLIYWRVKKAGQVRSDFSLAIH